MNSSVVFAVLATSSSLPIYYRNEISLSKNFVADVFQVLNFMIINADKNNPIIRQQISCQHQARVNHAAPVGVKASIGVGILEQAVFVLVIHSHLRVFFFL